MPFGWNSSIFLRIKDVPFTFLYWVSLDYPRIKAWKGVAYFHKVKWQWEQTALSLLGNSVGWGFYSLWVTRVMPGTCHRRGSCRLGAQGRIARQAPFIFLAPSHFLADSLSLRRLCGLSEDLTEAAIQSLPAACCFGEAAPSDHLFHECFQIGGLRPLPQVILNLLKVEEET